MRVIAIERNGQSQQVLTFLADDEIAQLQGLPPQSVAGLVHGDGELQVNAVFREFLHECIAAFAPLDPDMQSVARTHGDGRLVFVDSRVPESVQPVPPEDILGWFQVRAGAIVPGSYLPNPAHRIDGAHGITAVVAGLRQAMVDELIARHRG